MRYYEFSQNLTEAVGVKTLKIGDLSIDIDMDHLMPRMFARAVDHHRVDRMLKSLPSLLSKIADIEPGHQFWIWNPQERVGLGFRKLNNTPKLVLKTAVSSPPKGNRNPLIVSEGLDVKTLSVAELAKKHKVPKEQILAQLKKGIEVEQEHTTDKKIAKEIALDHLKEFPDYYDRLAKAEK